MRENVGKNTWTAILNEVFHPGSPQLKLGKEDSRESERWRSGKREIER